MTDELTLLVRQRAIDHGADLVGICSTGSLPKNQQEIGQILPGARSVVVVVAGHSISAMRSADVRVQQYDTVYNYQVVRDASLRLARDLERHGHYAVAVPAFIPIDMADEKQGMRGDVDWRGAAVAAGLGSYGESGLLLTEQLGPNVRIGGLLTTAALAPDAPRTADLCDHCLSCVKACPVSALSGAGQVERGRCGDRIFAYGLRAFVRLLRGLGEAASDTERKKLLYSHLTREVWQTFMVGNYYYCDECIKACPAGTMGQRLARPENITK